MIEAAEWRPFRNALPKSQRKEFDLLLDEARHHTTASSMAVRTSRFEGMFMAILFHHYIELVECKKSLEEAESRIKETGTRAQPLESAGSYR